MNSFNKFAAFMAVAAASQLASAANFNFTGLGNSDDASYTTSDGGIGLTVTSGGGNADDGLYRSNIEGFGNGSCFFCLGGIQSDGESVIFTFDQAVDITTIRLRQWEGPDGAILGGDAGGVVLDTDSSPFSSSETFTVNLTNITSLDVTGFGGLSIFYVAELGGVTATPPPVPVPAAAWLFGSALLGLAGIRRRS